MSQPYYVWLAAVSLPFIAFERLAPRRPDQRFWRPGLVTDWVYFVLNGHFLGVALAVASAPLVTYLEDLARARGFHDVLWASSLHGMNPILQFVIALLMTDFVQWSVHNALHRIPFLWEFHKVHHSIVDMDFWGSLRFHWMEPVLYKTAQFLPLAWMGADPDVMLAVAVAGTVIGHMNHANVNISFGPLAYILNSPRMHVWHHAHPDAGPTDRNFGITLAIWDWVFGTAYLPADPPSRLGFADIEHFPTDLPRQELWPIRTP